MDKKKTERLLDELFIENEQQTNQSLSIIMIFAACFLTTLQILDYIPGNFYLGTPICNVITWGIIAVLVLFSVLGLVLNKKHRPWLKYLLLGVICIACSSIHFLFTMLASIFLLLPVFISARYYQVHITYLTDIFMWVLCFITQILNMVLDQTSPLIQQLHAEQGLTFWSKPLDVLDYEIVPIFLMFLILSFVSGNITRNGRRLVVEQSTIMADSKVLENELATAAEIQQKVLPKDFSVVDPSKAQLFASMTPAKEVAGDFYDFAMIEKNKLALVIADVSGKGLPAALAMMAVKNSLRMLAQSKLPLKKAVEIVNRATTQNNQECMFVTFVVAYIDIRTGYGKYVNAGHTAPIILHKDGSHSILENEPDVFAGAFENAEYHEHMFSLKTGDTLFLYTDGATDARDPSGKTIGFDGLLRLLTESTNEVNSLCQHTLDGLHSYMQGTPQYDDITMLALHRSSEDQFVEGTDTEPATKESIQVVMKSIESVLMQYGCPKSVRELIRVVIDELAINIVSYAYEGMDKKDPTFTCNYVVGPSWVKLTFIDDGIAFDPIAYAPDPLADEPKIGGVGIQVVKGIADSIQYERKENQNILTIYKLW